MLEPVDFARVDGIQVTGIARTLLDLAGEVTPLELARAVDRTERLDLFDLAAVDEVLARARGRRGAAALRRAVAAWRPRQTRSELEDRHLELLEEAGLPRPLFNVLLQGELGSHEVDTVWPSQRLVVQLDGFAYHRTRRDQERDAATDADLELAGYRVVRLTWDDVTARPNRTARRLRLLLLEQESASDT
jgi:very-short-patch-repair endonuclease